MNVVKTSRTPEELRSRLQVALVATTDDLDAVIGPVSSLESNAERIASRRHVEGGQLARSLPGRARGKRCPGLPDVRPPEAVRPDRSRRQTEQCRYRRSPGWRPTVAPRPAVLRDAQGRRGAARYPALPDGWLGPRSRTGRPGGASEGEHRHDGGIHGIDITDGKADFLEYDSALGETPLRRHFAVEKATTSGPARAQSGAPHD